MSPKKILFLSQQICYFYYNTILIKWNLQNSCPTIGNYFIQLFRIVINLLKTCYDPVALFVKAAVVKIDAGDDFQFFMAQLLLISFFLNLQVELGVY